MGQAVTFRLLPWHEARDETLRLCHMQLWEVDGNSQAITARAGDELHVIAYQGRDVMRFALALGQAAQQMGLKRVRWKTKRHGLARMLKALNPHHDGDDIY